MIWWFGKFSVRQASKVTKAKSPPVRRGGKDREKKARPPERAFLMTGFQSETDVFSGSFGLLSGVATLAFFARQGDRSPHSASHEFHQPLNDAFIGVNSGTGQNLAAIARASPAGDLFRAVAILLVVGDGVVECGQHNGREQFSCTIALFIVKGSAVNEIFHLVFLIVLALAIFGVTFLMTYPARFGYPEFA